MASFIGGAVFGGLFTLIAFGFGFIAGGNKDDLD